MAIHSSILAWEVPWTEEPGGLQSTGSQRTGHNRGTKRTYTCMHAQSALMLFKFCKVYTLKMRCKMLTAWKCLHIYSFKLLF